MNEHFRANCVLCEVTAVSVIGKVLADTSSLTRQCLAAGFNEDIRLPRIANYIA